MGCTMIPTQESHERKSKNISGCSTVCIGRTKLVKEISIKVKNHDHPKVRTKETMEIDQKRPQKKCFLYHKGEHVAKYCKSGSVNALVEVGEPEIG